MYFSFREKDHLWRPCRYYSHVPQSSGFSLDLLDMGVLSPAIWGESAWVQSVNGGTHEGEHRRYGEDLTLIDYIIN